MSLRSLKAATAAASLLQAPHQGAQNHKRTSRPAKDNGSNNSPKRLERSNTVSATGTPAPIFSAATEFSTVTPVGSVVLGTFEPTEPFKVPPASQESRRTNTKTIERCLNLDPTGQRLWV